MLIRKPNDIASSEITGKTEYESYLNRRKFLRGAAAAGAAALGVEKPGEILEPRIRAKADTKLRWQRTS